MQISRDERIETRRSMDGSLSKDGGSLQRRGEITAGWEIDSVIFEARVGNPRGTERSEKQREVAIQGVGLAKRLLSHILRIPYEGLNVPTVHRPPCLTRET